MRRSRWSRPARGEWIEIALVDDGNLIISSRPARGEWIEIGRICSPRSCTRRLAPHGASGLKWYRRLRFVSRDGLAPHGASGLKLIWIRGAWRYIRSRPARGEWIEIAMTIARTTGIRSRPARGEWIEIKLRREMAPLHPSRPARGEWIEIWMILTAAAGTSVSPRTGRVD